MPPGKNNERLYALTEQEIQLLNRLLKKVGDAPDSRQEPIPRDVPISHQATDFYIAKVPAGGIPGLEQCQGTGDADEPGSAVCEIYKIDQTTTPPRMEYAGHSQTIYNISTQKVETAYTPVTRDKYGTWITNPGLGDGDEVCGTGSGTGTGTGTGGEGEQGTGSGTGTGDIADCIWEINDIHLEDLQVVTDPDVILGLRHGCIVLVDVGACTQGTGSA